MSTPSWKTRIEAAKIAEYLTTSLNEDRAHEAWQAYCRANRLPFLHVRPVDGKVNIALWMALTGRPLTPDEQTAAWAFDYSGGRAVTVSEQAIVVLGVTRAAADRVATFIRGLAAGTARPVGDGFPQKPAEVLGRVAASNAKGGADERAAKQDTDPVHSLAALPKEARPAPARRGGNRGASQPQLGVPAAGRSDL
jgi:hypothetical protein